MLPLESALGTVSAKACITAIFLTLGISAQETLQHQGGNLAITAALLWAETARRGDGDLTNTTSAPAAPNEKAQHILDPETTSSIQLQQHKRQKTADVQTSPTIDLTGKPSANTRLQTDIATTAVSSYLDELEHKTRVKKQVIQDLASWLDMFVDKYAGEHQADHRSEARTYIGKLANYLNSVAFSATTTTSRMPKDQQGAYAPRSNGLGEPAAKPVSWAGLARSAHATNPTETIRVTDKREGNPRAVSDRRNGKEDNRILIRLSTEHRVNRGQPFALRAALRREFGDLNLQLTDVPNITPTNTG